LARRDYLEARGVVDRQHDAAAEARQQLEQTDRDMLAAVEGRDARIAAIHHAVRARELRMEVQGPHSVQAGVAADYQVRTVDLNGQPAPAAVVARLVDRVPSRTELAAQEGKRTELGRALEVREQQPGLYKVSVPPTLRLDPGQPLGMVVEARRKDG